MKRKRTLQLSVLFAAILMFAAGCNTRPTPVSVNMTPNSAVMEVGETRTLTAAASDGSAIEWSTSNVHVVSVDGTGKVSAISAGQATVTATAVGSQASAECMIQVQVPKTPSVDLDPPVVDPDSPVVDPDPPVVDPDPPVVDPDPPVVDPDPPTPQWTLSWNDEFDGASLDLSKWSYQLGVQDDYYGIKGPWAWGNEEQQFYTKEAVSLEKGALKITATREAMPEDRKYSSARIVTRDNYFFTYGYVEARMKTPAIDGMWPAFWALPQPTDHRSTQNKYGGWPYSGEIDIMEAQGRRKNVVGTTLHYGGSPGQWQSTYRFHDTVLSSSTEEWHTYGLDWRETYLAWYIDGAEVFRIDNKTYWTGAVSKEENPNAPFDVPFYLLLDLAVGGNYDGGVEPPESFTSAAMYVDYVRVYRLN